MTTDDREDGRTLETLDESECRYLMRWEAVGRVAFDDGQDAPAVLPVNFVVADDAIVFRTEAGLAERLVGRAVSFQVDRTDDYRRVGWSVLVRGHAQVVDEQTRAGLQIEPWAPGNREAHVRIVATSTTGRRLELVRAPTDERGYL